MEKPVIELDSIYKYYKLYQQPKDRLKEALHPFNKAYHKKFYSLKDINLKVGHGEVLGIVGKNGSGKSTLLKLISGVLQPSSGKLTINGKVTALLELGGGFNPEFTGMENIHFYARVLGYKSEQIKEKIDEIIAFADIGDFIHQPVRTYSSGMKSRLSFAVAVHVDPEVLILDEVLAVGDALFKRKCYRKMEEFFNGGKTVIFVSHEENAIIQHCTRAILLHEHRIYLDGATDEIISAYRKILYNKSETAQTSEYATASALKNKVLTPPPVESQKSDFLPSLVAKPVHTNASVVRIDAARITMNNEQVNLLTQKARYTINFNCTFMKPLKGVSIGAQIRSINGLLISGANYSDTFQKKLEVIDKDEKFGVDWSFTCLMVPGVYTVYLFVTSENSHDTVIVDDAIIFKVKPVKSINGGFVTLDQDIKITKI